MTPTTDRPTLIAQIAALPEQLAAATADLSAKELTTPYLAGEWTVAQNVHHLADSHLNAYVRCKLIATEEQPVFKPYDQDAWALFPDAQRADLTVSLALLGSLHVRRPSPRARPDHPRRPVAALRSTRSGPSRPDRAHASCCNQRRQLSFST
jgi:hypothetical protein